MSLLKINVLAYSSRIQEEQGKSRRADSQHKSYS